MVDPTKPPIRHWNRCGPNHGQVLGEQGNRLAGRRGLDRHLKWHRLRPSPSQNPRPAHPPPWRSAAPCRPNNLNERKFKGYMFVS